MPGSMNGLRLAEAVRGRWPPIKTIATSVHYVVRDGDLPSGGLFLAKPYSLNQIPSALREITAQA
jgi:two-component system, response regulator PdtaR